MINTMNDHTKLLSRVRSLVERNERITRDDCAMLFDVKDLGALAGLARIPRERRFGRDAYYFPGAILDDRGEVDPEEADASLVAAIERDPSAGGMVRLRSSGELPADAWYSRLGVLLHGTDGAGCNVSPRFVDELALAGETTHSDILARLAAITTVMVSGDEAELFDPDIRAVEGPLAMQPESWLAVHRAAHALGIASVAAMSYGTVSHADAFASHLERLRTLQDETNGFVAFVPTAIHNPEAEEFYLSSPTAVQTLRATVIARIFLDNIPHILIPPSLVGLEIATVALSYGADTLDRTVAVGDVLSTEPSVVRRAIPPGDLPIVAAGSAEASRYESADRLRSRILEARWHPIAVDQRFRRTGTQAEDLRLPV